MKTNENAQVSTDERNASVGLVAKLENYKKIAREGLRMNLISPRLSRIAGLETDVKNVQEDINDNEHQIKVENYEISKLDTEHPNYDKKKESKELNVKHYTESNERLVKNMEETNKLIAEQRENIAKIESGETKVSLDELNSLVEDMVKQDVLNKVA